jgi:hypothetical protein
MHPLAGGLMEMRRIDKEMKWREEKWKIGNRNRLVNLAGRQRQ